LDYTGSTRIIESSYVFPKIPSEAMKSHVDLKPTPPPHFIFSVVLLRSLYQELRPQPDPPGWLLTGSTCSWQACYRWCNFIMAHNCLWRKGT